MITVIIAEMILTIVQNFEVLIFGNLITPLTNLSNYIQAFYVPQTLLDIFAMVNLFLPMATINVLLGFTGLLIGAKIVMSMIHFLPGLFMGS